MPVLNRISAFAASALLAGSIGSGAPPASAEEAPRTGDACRLIVTPKTEQLYPDGFLELAARNCWAGENTDIVILGKDDLLPSGNSHFMMVSDVAPSIYARLRDILPADAYELMDTLKGESRERITSALATMAAQNADNTTFQMRFKDREGVVQKSIFFAVADPIYFMDDQLAASAGLSLGLYIDKRLHEDTATLDRASLRSWKIAHEMGHGVLDHHYFPVQSGAIQTDREQELKRRQPHSSIEFETGADRMARAYYSEALAAGINLAPSMAYLDIQWRSASAYYSDRFESDRTEHDYTQAQVSGYLGNPEPYPTHATSAGLHPDRPLEPEEQLQGALKFRREMDLAIGNLFFDAADNHARDLPADITDHAGRSIEACAEMGSMVRRKLAELPPEARGKADPTAFVGGCLARSGVYNKGLAVNGMIALIDQGGIPGDKAAQLYLDDFTKAVESGLFSAQFLHVASLVYASEQRETLSPESKLRWDRFFVKHDAPNKPPSLALR